MNLYVKTDKFGYDCGYLTEDKVYKVDMRYKSKNYVNIKDDVNEIIPINLTESCHTDSVWYFCDEQGNRLESN